MTEGVKLRSDATELSSDCERYKKTINDLNDENEKLKANIRKLTGQLTQKQDETNKLIQNNKVLEQEIKDQTGYIDKINLNNEKLFAENSQLKKLYDDCVKETGTLWEENKGLKSHLNEAQGTIEELNNIVQANQQQINELLPENENLRHFNDDIKGKLSQTIEDNKKFIQDRDIMEAQNAIKVQASFEEVKRLNEEIMKLKTDNERLKVRYIFILE